MHLLVLIFKIFNCVLEKTSIWQSKTRRIIRLDVSHALIIGGLDVLFKMPQKIFYCDKFFGYAVTAIGVFKTVREDSVHFFLRLIYLL